MSALQPGGHLSIEAASFPRPCVAQGRGNVALMPECCQIAWEIRYSGIATTVLKMDEFQLGTYSVITEIWSVGSRSPIACLQCGPKADP